MNRRPSILHKWMHSMLAAHAEEMVSIKRGGMNAAQPICTLTEGNQSSHPQAKYKLEEIFITNGDPSILVSVIMPEGRC